MRKLLKETLKFRQTKLSNQQTFNYSNEFKNLDLSQLNQMVSGLEQYFKENPIAEEIEMDEDLLKKDFESILNEFEGMKEEGFSKDQGRQNNFGQTNASTNGFKEEDEFEEEEEEDEKENEMMKNLQMKIQQEFQQKKNKEKQTIEKFSKNLNKGKLKDEKNETFKQLQRLGIDQKDLKKNKNKKDKNKMTTGQMQHSKKIKDTLQFVLTNINKDEKIRKVQVKEVYLNKDFRSAKIKYEIENKRDRKIVSNTLKKISGFLSSEVGKRLDYKYAPMFTWFTDVNLNEKSNNKIVNEIQQGMEELKKLGFSEKELKEYYEKQLKDEFI
eukprot:gene8405-230_t